MQLKSTENNIAAIDIGTNSVHLVIVRPSNGRFEVLTTEKEAVRLGSGAGDLDVITDAAMERTVQALYRFVRIAGSYNATVRAVATSAVREAKNQDEFLQKVEQTCKLQIEVIPGHEEARLIYLGLLQALPLYRNRILMIDIGGGSTEYLVGFEGLTDFAVSLKLGSIRLSDHFFPDGDLHPEAVEQCRTHIKMMLERIKGPIRNYTMEVAVGCSGTIETLCEMCRIKFGEKEETSFSSFELNSIIDDILGAKCSKEIAKLPGLDEKRADIIGAGALLLQESMRSLDIRQITVSPYALREGVIFDTLQRNGYDGGLYQIRRNSVIHLAESTRRSAPAQHCAFLGKRLYQELLRHNFIEKISESQLDVFESACILHNTGMAISHSAHHKHSYYIIKHTDLLQGFTPGEIDLIATLSRYHRKAYPDKKHPEFSQLTAQDQQFVRIFSGILRVAIALDRGYTGDVADITSTVRGRKLIVEIIPRMDLDGAADISLEIHAALERSDLLERSLGISTDYIVS